MKAMILFAGLFVATSTAAIAEDATLETTAPATSQAVKLTDAELDNITAGSPTFVTAVFNPGKANIPPDVLRHNTLCVNCLPSPFNGTAVFIFRPGDAAPRCMGPGCP